MKAMCACVLAMIALTTGCADADEFPSQPIRFIAPFSAGE